VDRVVDGSDMAVESGFVDLQVNGGFGHDFTADPGRIWDVAARLPEHGVTAFLPTLISPTVAEARAADAVLAAGPPADWLGAVPLGLHLEGPALNPVLRGAHPADRLVEPTEARVGEWLGLEHLSLVTLAPELPGALTAIERIVEAGAAASIGHTAASAAQVTAAADAGVTMVTHLFNAMAPFHHRDPGPIGAALTDDRLSIGLIADGVHVASEALALAWRAAGPERIILTTDAIAGLGTDADAHGGQTQADGPSTGRTLRGGTTPYHDVRRSFARAISSTTELPSPSDAWLASSVNSRRLLGRGVENQIAGDDLVVLDSRGRPALTVVSGRPAFTAPGLCP
jgi:N-acetylglucosamine-6-phosphate deacetylase